MKDKKAIALNYSSLDIAPKVTAKGKNELAVKILELAKENDIPIHKDSDLVEILYLIEIGYTIPEELYSVIAEILAFIYLANDKFKQEYE